MSNLKQYIKDIETRTNQAGYSIAYLCKKAGICNSSWTRWKAGLVKPNMETWEKILTTLFKFEAKSKK